MNPDAARLWPHPRWMLAALLAGLGTLGPFAIDTYLPAFSGIAATLQATPAQMQQTLSAYLFGFAALNLFHGAISDSLGRRPVVLVGLVLFTVASVGCAMSDTIGDLIIWRTIQGMTAGAGSVVSRAIIRDLYPVDQAQKLMSLVTIFFGIAPAIAPLMGGWLFVLAGWHSIFWLLVGIGTLLLLLSARFLPESLHVSQRQPFALMPLLRGYRQLAGNPRFVALVMASGIPFNGSFLYVLSAPAFLGEHLGLQPQQFFWFFLLTIAGIMAGSWTSGRVAGKIPPKQQIRWGFSVMLLVSVINVAANLMFTAHAAWALLPIAGFAFGWALMVPVITLLVLDLYPERRGLSSSLQAVIGSTANGLVAGAIAPLVMHSTRALAIASLLFLAIGLAAWLFLHRRWPEIGRAISAAA